MFTGSSSNKECGFKLIKEGKFDECIEFLTKAVREEPSDVDLRICLAYAYSQTGDEEKPIEILEQAADLDPCSAKVHYNLGVAYQKAHNATQAKEEYLRALGLDAKYVQAKNALDALPHPQ